MGGRNYYGNNQYSKIVKQMEYFYQNEKNLLLLKNKKLLLMFDFDGTLTPLTPRPEDTKLNQNTRNLLKKIAEKYITYIVSGRDIKFLQKTIKLKNINYIGSHGLEMPKSDLVVIPPKWNDFLKDLTIKLNDRIKKINGSFIEIKTHSICLHYREVKEADLIYIKQLKKELKTTIFENEKLKIKNGILAFEILPPLNWHKGKAVKWLLTKYPQYYPIYIGDDKTDEFAFKMLKEKGLTIVIGKKKSMANYYFNEQTEIIKFLKLLINESVTK